MSERMVGKITFGGVELQTPILDVPRDSAERDAMERHYSLGFRAGCEAMREAAAMYFERHDADDLMPSTVASLLWDFPLPEPPPK